MKLFILFCSIFFVVDVHAQDYTLEGNEVKLSQSIVFKTGTDELLPESNAALAIIQKYLTDKTYISTLRIEGHVSDANKQLLTEKRALAVARKLIELGVDCKRLIAVGFGNTKPIAGNSTPEGKAQNNRIGFFNAALRGRLIGGMPADGGGKVAGELCQ